VIPQADLKRLRALQQKKFRTDEQRFLVQGRKVVRELLSSTFRTEALYATEDAAAYIRDVAGTVPLHVLPAHDLERIGTFETGSELVAVAVQAEVPSFRAPGAGELMLALDDIHDPRNMGGLLRIADWFGITRILCSPDCMEIYNPKVVQSSMGSIFRVEVRYAPLKDQLTACAAGGAAVYLANMEGTPVYEAALRRPAVLVLGSESHGLSEALRALDATVLSVPRVGHAESLNVAMAATALCTEFARQAAIP